MDRWEDFLEWSMNMAGANTGWHKGLMMDEEMMEANEGEGGWSGGRDATIPRSMCLRVLVESRGILPC